MELWFSERHTPDVELSIRVDKQLYSSSSDFQRIDIYQSPEFGRFLTLDGFMMLTEKDEFIYHEMIVHPAMAVSPDAKKILVIGAGDGGVVRELTKYDSIQHIDLVEIDAKVIEACKEFLPQTASALGDSRVAIHIADGLKYIRPIQSEYDIIIVDSTDPFGPGEGLFTKEFYGNCYKALNENGIMINQHESPFYSEDAIAMKRAHMRISESFDISMVYQAHIPTYPSGHWLFGFAAKTLHPLNCLDDAKWISRGIKTKYYNTALHRGSFALPNYVQDMLIESLKK